MKSVSFKNLVLFIKVMLCERLRSWYGMSSVGKRAQNSSWQTPVQFSWCAVNKPLMLCCRSVHGSSKTPQPYDASVTICTRVYIGVYAALLHGFSHLLSVVSSAPDVAASASSARLDSPWYAAPRGQSSCRVQFAVSSSVRPELRDLGGRGRWHSIGIAAEQAALVRSCVAKRWRWLGEEMYGAWSWGSKTKGKTEEDLERGCTW